jgi:hypothetical protein
MQGFIGDSKGNKPYGIQLFEFTSGSVVGCGSELLASGENRLMLHWGLETS